MKNKELLREAEPLTNVFLQSIRRRLRTSDLNQENIADLMKTTPSHISERLNARLEISIPWLFTLCVKSGIKPSALIDIEAIDREFELMLKKDLAG